MSMNELLAQMYGNAQPKQAQVAEESDPSVEKTARLELFAKLAAEEGIDLSELSAEQINQLYKEAFAEETTASEEPAKEAQENGEEEEGKEKKAPPPPPKKEKEKAEEESEEEKEGEERAEAVVAEHEAKKEAAAKKTAKKMAKKAGKEKEKIKKTAKKRVKKKVKLGPLAKEKTKHIKRLAKIDRLEQIARKKNNDKLLKQIQMLREKENRRHEKVMARISSAKVQKTKEKGKIKASKKADKSKASRKKGTTTEE